MRKALVMMLSLCLMTFFLSCGGGKYSDVKKINEEYIEVLEKYIAAIDKSDNAKDIAKAMTDEKIARKISRTERPEEPSRGTQGIHERRRGGRSKIRGLNDENHAVYE